MQGNSFNERAAASWLDHIAKVPKQPGLDSGAPHERHHPRDAPAPGLDISATQTPEQQAIAAGLKELELIKREKTVSTTKGKT